MENGTCIDGLPIKNGDFPMAMLNNQRVYCIVSNPQPVEAFLRASQILGAAQTCKTCRHMHNTWSALESGAAQFLL